MSNEDPFDPFGTQSPWDSHEVDNTTTQEPPVTNPVTSSPNPFKIGMTLKAAAGYDAEWFTPTVYGATAEQTAQGAKALIVAMKSEGLIDLVSKAADYVRSTHKPGGQVMPPAPANQTSFQNGQVVQTSVTPPSAPAGGGQQGVTTCAHGARNYKNGGTWEAMFCSGPRGAGQCEAAFKNKNTGLFELKL